MIFHRCLPGAGMDAGEALELLRAHGGELGAFGGEAGEIDP